MSSAWIFQSNPDRYDIDTALDVLDVIHWRVPQYTHRIRPGDDALIWRAGDEAGVVAVGKVLSPPRKKTSPQEEARFYRESGEKWLEEPTTRVPLRVERIPLIPKHAFARIADLAEHQIVVAPRQTVFPLTGSQWTALIEAHPPLENLEDVEPDDHEESASTGRELPETFAWEDRKKSVYPLPGGYDEYVRSLERILERVKELRPNRRDLETWITEQFGVSDNHARFCVNFLERTSLLTAEANRVELSPHGSYWLEERDVAYLIGLLHSRLRLVGELLEMLAEPRSPDRLLELANERYGMGWNSRAQIDRRRGWLQSTGAVEIDDEGRLVLTDVGQNLRDRLEIESPREVAVKEEPAAGTEEERPDRPLVAPKTDALPVRVESEPIIDELEDAASDSANPDRFEKAVTEAFSFLGFDSSWMGGSGKTDVLLVAELGPEDGYRVIVDCKSTGRGAVPDAQIDWMTLGEHREAHHAEYVALVGPRFTGSRVRERARQTEVRLLDVETLSSLIRQHAAVPLGLDDYRSLFDNRDEDEAAAEIGEAAEEVDRLLQLSAQVVRLIEREEGTEGPLSARDLYWLLRDHSDDLGEYTEDEIQRVLQALASPGLGVLREVSGRYGSLGSIETTVARLRALAGHIAGQGGLGSSGSRSGDGGAPES